MIGVFGLHQHFAGAFGAAGAAGNLHDGLCQAFRGPKVGTEQALVGVQYHHQRHARKVMPLGDHLRAHQDACRATHHRLHDGFQLSAGAGGIAIQA